MFDPNYVLLYVDNPLASEDFYTSLLGHSPVESSPGFVMFVLQSGVKLGLWAKHTVEPAASATGGGAELAFTLADAPAVRTLCETWKARGLRIAQEPTQLDFGYTFVALDPDGHRLRAFAPSHA
jgi:catechol 2,3-dioxygenase-like lactoylglutathione lyase family enzyme